MRTIYLVSHAVISGPINQALNILTGLKHSQHTNAMLLTFIPESDKSWLSRFIDNGIEYKQLNPIKKTNVITCSRQLKQFVEENNIYVIHASGFSACLVALMGHGKAKVVITQRCYPFEVAEELPKVFRPFITHLYLWMIKRVNERVACSYSMQKAFADQVNINMKVVQNGVNTDYFKPIDPNRKIELRRSLGLPTDKRINLVLGVLLERKNNAMIIDAFKRMESSDNVLIFVGTGPQEEMLKNKAGDSKKIIFAGSTSRPLDYLQASDVLISSSLAEGLPNTVLEALSCGLPCVLSDIDPHKELIEGTTAGVLFNTNSVDDLYEKIKESEHWVLSDKSQYARKIAVENHGVISLAEKYEGIYRSVLNK